ncbi:hypothetical protein KHA90_07080 [Flavobacterium psychroterrae]|uniref:Uncharacterized protein n=1 Tax=Flavobacterium psychroterrae TaxID=2133767 RepID=A0ABS5P907_9FLAO|nr:hypothetical protein [Flavobacterium psychroterrae]MBS7230782.1 hypothetical protein [Flavobacterium psychroterrae]
MKTACLDWTKVQPYNMDHSFGILNSQYLQFDEKRTIGSTNFVELDFSPV